MIQAADAALRGAASRRRVLRQIAGAAAAATVAPRARAAAPYRLTMLVTSNQKAVSEQLGDVLKSRAPGSTVSVKAAPFSQLITTARVQLASGTASDIVTIYCGGGNPLSVRQLAPAGLLVDLTALGVVVVPPAFRDLVYVGGKAFFVPLATTAVGLIVNRRVAQQIGLQQPTGWSGLLDVCATVKAAGKTPIALGLGTSNAGQFINYALMASTVGDENPQFAADMAAGKASFAGSAGWHESFAKYAELGKRGCFQDNPLGTTLEEAIRMVATGDAAMTVLVADYVAQVIAAAGHRDFVLWPMPAYDDDARNRLSASPSPGFGITSSAKDPEGATALLKLIAEPESQTIISRATNLPTARGAIAPEVAPFINPVLPMLSSGRVTVFPDYTWPNARVQQTHNRVVQEMFGGTATIDQALGKMDEAYRAG
jgi:raffinose/stachyose/melibiose transport system substrate-binding protein